MPVAVPVRQPAAIRAWLLLLAAVLATAGLAPLGVAHAVEDTLPDHLVISEVVTGGASASDELIEIHNPTPTALPLEGLELIYVSSTGGTISRRAAWSLGAPSVGPGGHLLVANESGLYAPIADAVYGTGMAATGGSVALRILGASTAIDAVGWGTAASTWREGTNAVAPAAGSSIERLPGGALGSTRDSDDNGLDFVERAVPEPQNMASPPTPAPGDPSDSPTPTPTFTQSAPPTPSASPTPSATPTPSVVPTPTASAGPTPVSVAAARAAPDGAVVTIEGTALTGSDFHDGGGYVVDASGGIAVIVEEGSFSRGSLLRISGTVDDRFSQRTLRAAGDDVVVLGSGSEPAPAAVPTAAVGEAVEGSLVHVGGTLAAGGTALTSGTAFDLDDGSGPVRVVVGTSTGIDLAAWSRGATLELVGIVGQRDSTGSGTEGYRVMPREAADVVALAPPSPTASASATPSSPAGGTPTPGPTATDQPAGVVSVHDARAAAKNARLTVRGVVTLAPATVDPQTAVLQDATGAIVLRLGDDVEPLGLGDLVEVDGIRSTKGGMETLRVTTPARHLGRAPDPTPRALRTGQAGEADEAVLVVARGALVSAARRASSGTVSFEIDDGSGPLRVSFGASLQADELDLAGGTWVEVRGILGQETTGAQPERGYRIWPRGTDDLRIVAAATGTGGDSDEGDGTAGGTASGLPAGGLDDVGGPDLTGLRIAATLVAGPWPELDLGGFLWDGSRLVAIAAESSSQVSGIRGARALPLSLELGGLRSLGTDARTGAPLVALGGEPGETVVAAHAASTPSTTLPGRDDGPTWVSLVGRLAPDGASLAVAETQVALELRCEDARMPRPGTVGVLGVATAEPARLIVPCGGILPASAVARLGTPSAAAVGTSGAPSASLASAEGDVESRRPLVVGLFLLAAVMLAGAALWTRRLADHDDAPTAAVDEGAATDEEAGSAPPRLTLVSVPREHGP